MTIFDTKIQYLKYQVLKEVAKYAFEDTLHEHLLDIPLNIVSNKKPTMRCCVYKERAILAERVKLAIGGDKNNPNVIEVIEIACDECPTGGYEVTNACRGCLAHHCMEACKFDAIYLDENHITHIDKDKCKECGACSRVCPYSAIISRVRPCQNACKIKAISMNEDKAASIDNSKCIACGACIYQCPFGAISDKSYILEVIDLLKNNQDYNVYAVIAPSIASQYSDYKLGQVISGLKKLGFKKVIEAALGADMVSSLEAKELSEKGFLTSSCCPAFVDYVEKYFPEIKKDVSHNLSPMATISKYVKENDPLAKVVFIGPCTAKKMEIKKETVKKYVDSVLTFEELQALFDSREIKLEELSEDKLDEASYYGRIFARSGGLTSAITEALKEQNIAFDLKAKTCNGIEECKMALLMKKANRLDSNFIEGMACINGCIGGAGCITHKEKNKSEIDKYSNESENKTIKEALKVLDNTVLKKEQ